MFFWSPWKLSENTDWVSQAPFTILGTNAFTDLIFFLLFSLANVSGKFVQLNLRESLKLKAKLISHLWHFFVSVIVEKAEVIPCLPSKSITFIFSLNHLSWLVICITSVQGQAFLFSQFQESELVISCLFLFYTSPGLMHPPPVPLSASALPHVFSVSTPESLDSLSLSDCSPSWNILGARMHI